MSHNIMNLEKMHACKLILPLLIAHLRTELYDKVIAQKRKPIYVVLNNGLGDCDYKLPKHVSTFERRHNISGYSSYITNYQANEKQIKAFDNGRNTKTEYENLLGNPEINTGPMFVSI